ncbi:Dihydrodipicolinate synthase [Pseudomonas savastanoi pv. savastanoi]|nr:Dihydrodipicolinate synthase [Pseudomonas savastanoi pv. savastanoi]
MQFRGIIPALVTPFTADQQLDEQALRNLIENLLNAGVHGLFVLGTNGEFFTLSESEKLKIARITVEAVAGRVPVVVGTGAFATHEVIEMNKKMIDVGADALSIITPYFNAISQSELIKHYTAIADAAELPSCRAAADDVQHPGQDRHVDRHRCRGNPQPASADQGHQGQRRQFRRTGADDAVPQRRLCGVRRNRLADLLEPAGWR